MTKIRSAVGRLEADSRAITEDGGTIAVPSQALGDKLIEYEESYRAVKEQSSVHQAKLTELANLEEQQRAAYELLQHQRSERDAIGKAADKHSALRVELKDVWEQRTSALKAECEKLAEFSGGAIRATLSTNRGFEEIQRKFKALIAGSKVRSNKIEAFFESLEDEVNPLTTWEQVLEELESLTLLGQNSEVSSEQAPTLTRLGLTLADQERFMSKLTPDGWLDLSLSEVSDSPEFEYRAKEGVYIPFDSASAGQQASALLGALLSQGGIPLIIDQPEDDLDSDTVLQIVSKVWRSKGQRQLLFVSHNANLVVNGDADLVLVCAYLNAGDQSAGHIKAQGAIDLDEVRKEITSVMEGGERAFRLRKEKYGF